jgi:hypothetical protein
MAKAASKGDLFELRLARLLFAEGAFVRRAIDLNMHFGENFTVTDLDLLAYRFSPALDLHLEIGESKSAEGKKGPKAADRLLWIHGVQELVGADSAFVATSRQASDRLRGLAEELGLSLLDERDLEHRERIQGLTKDSPWGPHDPDLLERQREVYEAIKDDEKLKRVYWFLRSEFWLATPVVALKRAFGALRLLGGRKGASAKDPSVLWLGRQAQVNITVALVELAGASYRSEPEAVREQLVRELAAGPKVDYATLEELSREADRYMMAVLKESGVQPGKQIESLGALAPSPPSYTESLIEVIERLAEEPIAAAALPRATDWHQADTELGVEPGDVPGLESVLGDVGRLQRLVAAFLEGQIKVPKAMLEGVLVRKNGSERSDRPVGDDDDQVNGEAATGKLFDAGKAASGTAAK